MRAGEGARELPAWDDEPAEEYIQRLAVRLGYLEPGAEPKSMPEGRRLSQSYEARLEELWRPRQPGDDDGPTPRLPYPDDGDAA